MINPYKILGITPLCTEEVAKEKYRQLVKKYHPDNVNGDAEKLHDILEAWKVLEKKGFSNKSFNDKTSLNGGVTHKNIFEFSRR